MEMELFMEICSHSVVELRYVIHGFQITINDDEVNDYK
jgi:hypothetical protein